MSTAPRTTSQRSERIEAIRALPDQLADLVRDLSATQLTTPFLDGEWTVAQNVHHVADAHMNGYIRCKLIVTEEHPPLKPYDQDRWALFADATDADISPSLDLLRILHARWSHFLDNLPDEAWQRTGNHLNDGTVTLDQLLQVYADHGLAHIEQITRTLSAQLHDS